jgi:hypothetical protein
MIKLETATIESLLLWLESGGNPNAQHARHRTTLLHEASYLGRLDFAKILSISIGTSIKQKINYF